MKALDLKLKKAEQRAIRSGAKHQAKKLAKQAGKFRADALAAGLKLHEMGNHPNFHTTFLSTIKNRLLC